MDFEKLLPGLLVKEFCDKNDIKTCDDLDDFIYNNEQEMYIAFRSFINAYLDEKYGT